MKTVNLVQFNFAPIELLAGSQEKSFSSFFAPVVSLLTMTFLLRNDFVSSVPISPVAPVMSTDFEAPGIQHRYNMQIKRVRKVCMPFITAGSDHWIKSTTQLSSKAEFLFRMSSCWLQAGRQLSRWFIADCSSHLHWKKMACWGRQGMS